MMAPSTQAELLAFIDASPRLRPVWEAVRATAPDDDAAHDQAHLLRVALSTCEILGERFEEAVAAALLHDLVNVPKNHPDRARASELSAEAARPILAQAGFSPSEIEEITLAVRQHSFSRGEKPSRPLAQALQDADRLEALGAIGLMRVFSTGVRMGAKYFHPGDPWAKNRELDDTAFSLDHFFTKLLRLPATMNTGAGRAEAERRARVLEDFIAALEHELRTPRRETQ